MEKSPTTEGVKRLDDFYKVKRHSTEMNTRKASLRNRTTRRTLSSRSNTNAQKLKVTLQSVQKQDSSQSPDVTTEDVKQSKQPAAEKKMTNLDGDKEDEKYKTGRVNINDAGGCSHNFEDSVNLVQGESGADKDHNIDMQDIPGTSSDLPCKMQERAQAHNNRKRVRDKEGDDQSMVQNKRLCKLPSLVNRENNQSCKTEHPTSRLGENRFEWLLVNETHNKRFNASERVYNLKCNGEFRGKVGEHLEVTGETFKQFLDQIKNDQTLKPKDYMRLVIISPELREPIATSWAVVKDMDASSILGLFEKVLQSNQHFFLHSGVSITVTHLHNPDGGGHKRKDPLDNEEYVKYKKGIIQVHNQDDLCFGKAIIKALYNKNGPIHHAQWKSIQNENKILDKLTKELYQKAGVSEGMVSYEDYSKFQDVLAQDHDVRLIVYSMRYAKGHIYDGPPMSKTIYLYHYDEHYCVISSMKAFLNRSYFCESCLVGYTNSDYHYCEGVCIQCKTDKCDARLKNSEPKDKSTKCKSCLRDFQTTKCYKQHLEKTCSKYFICKECFTFVNMTRLPANRKSKQHECGDYYCKLCSSYVSKDHQCFMQKCSLPDSDNPLPEKYIFYDFECQQNTGKHVPNLVVAHWTCSRCLDLPLDTPDRETEVNSCKICEHAVKDREVVFEGENTVDEFCAWLFQEKNNQYEIDRKGKEKLMYRTTAIAHNAQGYDLYFVMNYMIKNGSKPDSVIRKGGKILHMARKQSNIRFIDSLSFLAMPLSKMPATFGLPCPKGYFPHYFNTPDNEQYCGPLPEPRYYGADEMMPKDREKFLKWHQEETNKGVLFDFQEEILRYCRLDVEILEEGCSKFRELFMSLTSLPKYKGIDPFKHAVTLPSACNLVFRALFLQEDTIPLLPAEGFQPKKPQSKKAKQWLHYQSEKLKCHLEYEAKVGQYYVDAYCKKLNTAFEYFGCAYHGCLDCYSSSILSPFSRKTMGQLNAESLHRIKALENSPQKPRVEVVWECKFDAQLKDKKSDAFKIVQTANIVPILTPRSAFFGGRCNALKLFHEVSEGEKIRYVDFTSLYPWVNKTHRYPIKQPEIIRENFKSLDDYFGLVQCKVLPPTDLYIPLLPSKPTGAKLMFTLCRTCAELQQQTQCHHEEKDRMFRGVWVSEELKKAVSLGYRIVELEEVWHFKESTQYDPCTEDTGLFAEYIDRFLKVKQESSGWPSEVQTKAEKERYISDYFEAEGIQLEKEKISHNPGLRAVAKAMLNTLWGKFGQSDDLARTKFLTDPEEVLGLLGSAKIEVNDLIFHNEDVCEAHYHFKEEFRQPNVNTNVVIAVFTTAYARLKLYSILEPLQRRVLYFDTDSVIYIEREGEYAPPLGNNLGELTDEVGPNGNYIHTFLSGGPKNYCYATDTGVKICKVRGITLNHNALQVVNFDTLNEMLKPNSSLKSVRVHLPRKITRDRAKKEIINKDTHKDYRVVYTKRVVQENGIDTLPYGYRKKTHVDK